MNTPLKFDHDPLKLDHEPLKFGLEKRPKTREKQPRKRPSFRFRRSDYRAHYVDMVAEALSSIVRHRRLIISFVAFALALACIIIPLIPRKYSAEALIYPNLLSREEGESRGRGKRRRVGHCHRRGSSDPLRRDPAGGCKAAGERPQGDPVALVGDARP
ncbi:hypothetical protein ACFIOY_37410 [Bradyrhizobium sp. TZ2]